MKFNSFVGIKKSSLALSLKTFRAKLNTRLGLSNTIEQNKILASNSLSLLVLFLFDSNFFYDYKYLQEPNREKN
jgi:hypothetical protein